MFTSLFVCEKAFGNSKGFFSCRQKQGWWRSQKRRQMGVGRSSRALIKRGVVLQKHMQLLLGTQLQPIIIALRQGVAIIILTCHCIYIYIYICLIIALYDSYCLFNSHLLVLLQESGIYCFVHALFLIVSCIFLFHCN